MLVMKMSKLDKLVKLKRAPQKHGKPHEIYIFLFKAGFRFDFHFLTEGLVAVDPKWNIAKQLNKWANVSPFSEITTKGHQAFPRSLKM